VAAGEAVRLCLPDNLRTLDATLARLTRETATEGGARIRRYGVLGLALWKIASPANSLAKASSRAALSRHFEKSRMLYC
jgi:hypothetical protein